jgi:hypothetical protein
MSDECLNCGSADFICDEQAGLYVCSDCGCCCDVVRVEAPTYKQLFGAFGELSEGVCAESLVGHSYAVDVIEARRRAKRQRISSNSAPYRRSTYFAERVSQWRELEPAIDDDDWDEIAHHWSRLSGNWMSRRRRWPQDAQYKIFATDHVMDRADCRLLLRQLDEKLIANEQRPRYVRKYLEKFLSIRHMLCGVPSTGIMVDEELVTDMKILFDQLQRPFNQARQAIARFSFVNYNFVFRRIFDYLGVGSYYARDFPPLKSRKKREDIIALWRRVLFFAQWPYINSDPQVFGENYGGE